jgi:hypothetical protein
VELALCHPAGAWNFNEAARYLENFEIKDILGTSDIKGRR